MIRYQPGSNGYGWHHDEMLRSEGVRTLSFIWYLNTLPEDHGTEFKYFDRIIKPEAGKLLIFPSNWCWQHRGLPAEQDKYIVTSWLVGGVTTNNSSV